jgi:GDP-4-dehydro-6-deoxy-D-mannose reductase
MIYHLAAQSSAAASFQDPVGTMDANLRGTLNLLEAVRALPEAAWPAILSVGSCEEYGPHPEQDQPLTETAALNPISPYAVSKVAQTLLCAQYVRAWQVPVVMVRSFSHTGPGQDARFAFPAFARQIAAAEAGRGPAEIAVGDLSAVRDFLHVRDVIDAYRLLMKEGRPGEIYNVCSGRALTIREGLEIMIAEAACPITVRTDPDRLRPADTPVMVGDNTTLKTETGWLPEWDMALTLRELLAEARRELT